MELLSFIGKATPYFIFALTVSSAVMQVRLSYLMKEVEEIKTGITWADTCKTKHIRIDERIKALEKKTGLDGGVIV